MTSHTWRGATDADLDELWRLVVACERADESPYLTTRTDLVEDMLDDVDLATDTTLAVLDDRLVAYGITSHHPTDETREHDRVILFGGVHPAHRRRGLGAELLERQLARAREIAADLPWPTDARVYSQDPHEGVAAVCQQAGMAPTRWFTDLRRDLSPLDRSVPVGVRVVAWQPDHDEPARRLKNLAWRDHWLSTDVSAQYWQDTLASTASRRDLNLVSVDADGEVIGLLQVDHWPEDVDTVGVDAAWVTTLATHPDHRGRGIASALLASAIDRFRDAGLEAILLNVDAASPTGANRLYERLGFAPCSRSMCHLLRVN